MTAYVSIKKSIRFHSSGTEENFKERGTYYLLRDTRTYIYFSLKMEQTHHSPQIGPNSTFLKKNGGKICAKISPVGMKYCTGLYLGTSREKDEKEKITRVTKIGFTILFKCFFIHLL
jgi:hypothetical protein